MGQTINRSLLSNSTKPIQLINYLLKVLTDIIESKIKKKSRHLPRLLQTK